MKWYNDDEARKLHFIFSERLKPIIAELCPDYALDVIGINRDFNTEEVILKLHLMPLGSIRVKPDTSTETSPYKRLK